MKLSLRAARVNLNLRQKDAAKLIGVTVDTIGNWERGKSYPNAIQIKEIEKAYHVTYDELIFLSTQNAFSVNPSKKRGA